MPCRRSAAPHRFTWAPTAPYFADRLVARVADSRSLEDRVRDHLERLDEKLEPLNCSARFYTRVAFAFRALDSLPGMREQISELALAPQGCRQGIYRGDRAAIGRGFRGSRYCRRPGDIPRADRARELRAGQGICRSRAGHGAARPCLAAILRPPIGAICGICRLRKVGRLKSLPNLPIPATSTTFLELCSSPETAEFKQMRASAFELDPADGLADGDRRCVVRRDHAANRRDERHRGSASPPSSHGCVPLKFAEAKAAVKRVDSIDRDVLKLTVPFAMLVNRRRPGGQQPGNDRLASSYMAWTMGCPDPCVQSSMWWKLNRGESTRSVLSSNQLASP